jgi:hypothetical protein
MCNVLTLWLQHSLALGLVYMVKEEIASAELAQYTPELHDAVEAICKSRQFSTSLKSCEFLRYIVHHGLRGNLDELKERLIGIALLGRTADYDTGSDAGVRVRANDVRKRLNAYYASSSDPPFTIDLASGSYVPRFFRVAVPRAAPPPSREAISNDHKPVAPPPVSLYVLAAPTMVALFLCVLCIRWQLAQEHPFTTFWQSALEDHHALLYVPASGTADGRDIIPRERLAAAVPLLGLAGQFHTQFALTNAWTPPDPSSDILVAIGPGDRPGTDAKNSPYRLSVEDTLAGRQIIDRSNQLPHLHLAGRAALLTITNGARRSIEIDGTDDAAISLLVRQLCERETFPEDLADSFQITAVTQLVFPVSPGAHATVLHEALPSTGSEAMQVH